jgi:ribosomal RNA-processing protein 8
MFAVPGWAVSAASLVQQKPSGDNSKRVSTDASSKKRKRSQDHAQASKVTGTELEKLWSQQADVKASQRANAVVQKKTSKGEETKHAKADARKNDNDRVKSGKGAHEAEPENQDVGAKLSSSHNKAEKRTRHGLKERKGIEQTTDREKKSKGTEKIPELSEIIDKVEQSIDSYESSKQDKKKKKTRNEEKTTASGVVANGVSDSQGKSEHDEKRASKQAISTMPAAPPAQQKLTPLQAKMRSKLTSARFRHLNETLYTTNSEAAMDLFTNSPDLFAEYHAGFSQQVRDSWPQNPVDVYIQAIKTRGAITDSKPTEQGVLPIPRRKTGTCTLADLGCGSAPLARGCQHLMKALQLKFHNFDLHAPNTLVTKADIASLPMRDGEADIAIFCLSLMGTNWISFIEEAWRILRGDGKGEVWIAEVKSRFGRVKSKVVENSVGKRRKIPKKPVTNNNEDDGLPTGPVFAESEHDAANAAINDETDITAFTKVITRRGFQLREGSVDKSNRMFVSMIFTKTGIPTAGKHKGLKWNGRQYSKLPPGRDDGDDVDPVEEAKVLKPCVYKTR